MKRFNIDYNDNNINFTGGGIRKLGGANSNLKLKYNIHNKILNLLPSDLKSHIVKTIDFPPQILEYSTTFKAIIEYQLVSLKYNGNDNPLIIFPGFSEETFVKNFKQIINYTRKSELFEQFSSIYIFNFSSIGPKSEGIKIPDVMQNDYGIPMFVTYGLIRNYINNNILNMFNNYTILATSAGAGIALTIGLNNSNVKGIYFSCPGYSDQDKELFELLEKAPPTNIPIKMSWAKDDVKIPLTDDKKGAKNINDIMLEQPNYQFIEIDTGGHIIHNELLDSIIN